MGRSPSRAAAAVLAAALLAAACGDDDTSTAAEEAAADDTDARTDEDPGEPADVDPDEHSDESTDAGTLVEVRVSGGHVDGGGRVPVALGDTVTIRVTSDVADHLHLHGYDVLADVGAGEIAELTFTADIPGVFEVELEDAGLPLLELEVS